MKTLPNNNTSYITIMFIYNFKFLVIHNLHINFDLDVGINFLPIDEFRYISLRLRMQNAVPAQPCVGKLGISLVLLNFLHCNFRLWFKTP